MYRLLLVAYVLHYECYHSWVPDKNFSSSYLHMLFSYRQNMLRVFLKQKFKPKYAYNCIFLLKNR